MKRSEMRELIRKELLKTVGGDAAKYIAEDILYIVEQSGMEPPARPNDYGAVNNLGVVTLINEWENE